MNLKLISTNIRFENEGDQEHNWPHRRQILARLLNQYQADIIGSQEGWRQQVQDLEGLINKLSIIDQHRQWIERRMYPCLFINTDKFDLIESGDIWLSETPEIAGSSSFESSFPRLCTWGLIKDKNSSEILLVANVHLDHVLEHTRERQAEVMAYQLSLVNSKKHPIILMGDFNAAPDSQVRDILSEGPLKLYDPWEKMGKSEETTYHKFQGNLPEGKRIDWFLLSDHFKVEDIFLDKSHENNIYPSDHFPLITQIKKTN